MMWWQENWVVEYVKSSRRPCFAPMADVLTAGEVISNDERDGEGIELKCLIQTE